MKLHHAAGKVLDKARRIAAHVLECSEDYLDYARGVFKVRGSNRSMTFAEVLS